MTQVIKDFEVTLYEDTGVTISPYHYDDPLFNILIIPLRGVLV